MRLGTLRWYMYRLVRRLPLDDSAGTKGIHLEASYQTLLAGSNTPAQCNRPTIQVANRCFLILMP
jgi:hypothetical protein